MSEITTGKTAPPELGTKDTILKGKRTQVHSLVANNQEILITGKRIRTARLADEWYEDVGDPKSIIQALKGNKPRADLFTFWQRLPDTIPHYSGYRVECDSIAALRVTTIEHWRKSQLNSKARNLLRKADKLGVVVKATAFDDAFIEGMADIFNETPVRQDKPFWHYAKSADTVKREFSRYLFREELFGAYYNDKLIGFIFLAHADKYALLGQILSKVEHRDKSPNNALIAKAVEVCANKHIPHLVYAMWTEGSLGHFKRQNGFERVDLPRYYVPLTLRGRLVLALRLHHGLSGIIPPRLRRYLIGLRHRWYSRRSAAISPGT